MSDIVERLRGFRDGCGTACSMSSDDLAFVLEAAAEIVRLREALRSVCRGAGMTDGMIEALIKDASTGQALEPTP